MGARSFQVKEAVPRPPLVMLRHFRGVRPASARRGMAALRSWLSRSVASFFRYGCGRGPGQERKRTGDAETAVARSPAPTLVRALPWDAASRHPQKPSRAPPPSWVAPGSSLAFRFSVTPSPESEFPKPGLMSHGGRRP